MSYTPDQTEKGILEKLIAGRMDYNTLWYGCRSLKSNRWNPYGIPFGCRSSFALHTFRSNINSRQMMGWLIVLWLSEEHLYPFMSLIRRCFLHKRSEAGSTRCALSLGYSSGRTMGYPVDFLSGIPILTLSSRHLINCRLVKSLDLLKCLPRNLSKGKYVTRRVESKATFQQAP
ncbi:hypothetical protein ASPSYDRAFT_541993 [Aspergillus sydowii CBS 593.65]|uniref:Uncharacterized protein n=1 Tax=Aspergillus sydowii CBS 593.65 TaxID=1036612 RepID=A0A1L9T0Y9_9EURO|nr:uncharacterized protein ASPSYDRAFT_541993 [Aspergillus sydowii CBS 593.65]OJJ53096.1 hypothetical protein ASPSYDRAFT_541993 [Aspergillus sydowii CBS 593.65]